MKADPLSRGYLFLLDKPEGLTSHDVVERVRKATGLARIGHSGTLDPMATGLLLLCAGGAARLQGFFTRWTSPTRARSGSARHGDVRPRGRAGRRRPRRRARRPRRRSRRAAKRSGASSCSRRRRTRPRRSAAGSSTRWRARARAVPSLPKTVRVSRLQFGPLADGRLDVLDRLLVRHLHPLDRERPRRAAGLRRPPGVAAAHADRRLPGRRRGAARALRGASRRPSGWRRRTRCRSPASRSRSPASSSPRSRPGRSAAGRRSRPGGSRRGRATGSRCSRRPTTCSRWARSPDRGPGRQPDPAADRAGVASLSYGCSSGSRSLEPAGWRRPLTAPSAFLW